MGVVSFLFAFQGLISSESNISKPNANSSIESDKCPWSTFSLFSLIDRRWEPLVSILSKRIKFTIWGREILKSITVFYQANCFRIFRNWKHNLISIIVLLILLALDKISCDNIYNKNIRQLYLNYFPGNIFLEKYLHVLMNMRLMNGFVYKLH